MADLTPNNREEHWLQGMVDGETTLTPNKRREYWYKEIVDAIGSGGGGGGAFVVNAVADGEALVLDKTWNEIKAAYDSGMHIDGHYSVTEDYVMVLTFFGFYAQTSPDQYDAYFYDFTNTMVMTFTSNSATGYPALTE